MSTATPPPGGETGRKVKRKEKRMELGKNVRKKREELGMTLAELAAKLGITVQMLSSIELGSKIPGLPLLMLMSTVLGESIDSLCKSN